MIVRSTTAVLLNHDQPRHLLSHVSGPLQTVYLTDEHQADRTTSETPFFCYTHQLMKINVGDTASGAPAPTLGALRKAGTDQQDQQLEPSYFDVSILGPSPCILMLAYSKSY
jgi:hypothetical protein